MKTNPSLRDQLLRKTSGLSPEEFPLYRQKLSDHISRCLRDERRTRIALLVTLGLAAGLYLLVVALHLRRPVELPEGLAMALVSGLLLAPVASLIFGFLYFFKYRSRLKSARAEAQQAELEQIRLEIAALKKEIQEKGGQ